MDQTPEFTEGFQKVAADAQDKAKKAFEKGSALFGEYGEFAKGNLEALGNEVRASSPQEMHDWVANEVAKWRKVVADAKIPQK